MDFDFDNDQQMLRETVRRWIEREYSFDTRREVVSTGGFSARAWRGLAELGLLGLQVAENHDGMGLGPVDAMVVMEELGRGLVLEPYAHAALLVPHLLAFAPEPIQQEYLPAISSGDLIVVLAHQERAARYRLNQVTTRAAPSGGTWLLNGSKSIVPAGSFAHAFIVPARVTGADDDASGLALFLVQRDSAGVDVRAYPTQDGASAAEIGFENTAARLLVGVEGDPYAAFNLLESAVDVGIAALCAEAVGVMEALLATTVEYMSTRKQFGVSIASFQALRHRIADVKLQLELARSMSYLASLRLGDPPDARRRALAQAKVQLGRSMRFVGQQCLQLHGAIGLTDEYVASHYFKRLTVMEMTFGDTLHQLGEVSKRMDMTAGVY